MATEIEEKIYEAVGRHAAPVEPLQVRVDEAAARAEVEAGTAAADGDGAEETKAA